MKLAPVKHGNKKVAYLPAVRSAAPSKKKLVSWLAVLVILYFSVLFASQYWRLIQLRHTLRNIEQDIQAVLVLNEEMVKEIERLHTPGYLEQRARQELGMVRPGELLFYFREADNPSSQGD